MTMRFSRDAKALATYLLICFLSFTAIAIASELIVNPFLAWLSGYQGYYLPPPTKIIAWCKLVLFAAVVCGLGVWFYDRKRFGR
jgi:hypothetical protein